MEGTGAANTQDYFSYGLNVPEDPVGVYGVYGSTDSDNSIYSLAMYEMFEAALEHATKISPELQSVLGTHANPGGLHWFGWNAIKNEAVGHTSLDLTKDLMIEFGSGMTAEDVHGSG